MAADRVISMEELKAHATEADCWILVHGKVYDVTKFLDEHPGGFDIILSNTGAAGGGRRGVVGAAAARACRSHLSFPRPLHPQRS